MLEELAINNCFIIVILTMNSQWSKIHIGNETNTVSALHFKNKPTNFENCNGYFK